MIMPNSQRLWTPRLAIGKEHNLEIVRQLEIVTVRDPRLAQFVQYVICTFCHFRRYSC